MSPGCRIDDSGRNAKILATRPPQDVWNCRETYWRGLVVGGEVK